MIFTADGQPNQNPPFKEIEHLKQQAT